MQTGLAFLKQLRYYTYMETKHTKGSNMRTALVFLIGFTVGWLCLWQIQSSANDLENQCLKRQIVTKYNCASETKFVEFAFNI